MKEREDKGEEIPLFLLGCLLVVTGATDFCQFCCSKVNPLHALAFKTSRLRISVSQALLRH